MKKSVAKAVPVKHRWSFAQNHLAGLSVGQWWRLLRENRFAVDPIYWHRVAFISGFSLLNSLFRHREERLFKKKYEQVEIAEAPLFILGYWRSGTTHLHNLLAQDTAQFAYPNTYEVLNPCTFLSMQKWISRIVPNRPGKRPMDNMALSFKSPQEDEFALLLMTGLSPYVEMSFPEHESQYKKYITLRDVPAREVSEWKAALLSFMKKLTLQNPRALLLKSPAHTARIRLLLEMFPKARFVHIHRHPLRVYQSARHTFDTMTWHTTLQKLDLSVVEERLLSKYKEFYDAYFEERALIPKGQFHEVSFDEVERDPVGATRSIYQGLNLPGFDAFEPKLRSYADSLVSYKKNDYAKLPPELGQKIYQKWRRSFDEWGYQLEQ